MELPDKFRFLDDKYIDAASALEFGQKIKLLWWAYFNRAKIKKFNEYLDKGMNIFAAFEHTEKS